MLLIVLTTVKICSVDNTWSQSDLDISVFVLSAALESCSSDGREYTDRHTGSYRLVCEMLFLFLRRVALEEIK